MGLQIISRNQSIDLPGVTMKLSLLALFAVLIMGMTACTSEPAKPAEKPQPKPLELETGRGPFQKAYIAARGWNHDALPVRLESQPNSDSKGADGKSAVWRATFASATLRAVKPYTWAGTDASDAPGRGITPGAEDNYNPSNSSTQTWDIAYLKVDSDQALQVAQKHGGDKILQQTPDTTLLYVLDWNHNTNELTWHVIYGTNRDEAKLRVAVNASTGDFIRVEK